VRDRKFYIFLHTRIGRNLVCAFVLLNVNVGVLFADDWKSDSITIYPKVKSSDTNSKWADVFFSAGVGAAHGGGDWGEFFYVSPAAVVGTELSLTSIKSWSIEILCHSWYGKVKPYYNDYMSYRKERYYIKIDDDDYMQYGFSFAVKYYLIGYKYSTFSLAIHLGTMFTFDNRNYHTNDFGIMAKHKISDDFSIGLSYRNLFVVSLDLGGGSETQSAPNLLIISLIY